MGTPLAQVRYVGVSNETSYGVMRFIQASEALGLPRIVSIQNSYSLLVRGPFETDLAEVGGVGPWSRQHRGRAPACCLGLRGRRVHMRPLRRLPLLLQSHLTWLRSMPAAALPGLRAAAVQCGAAGLQPAGGRGVDQQVPDW